MVLCNWEVRRGRGCSEPNCQVQQRATYHFGRISSAHVRSFAQKSNQHNPINNRKIGSPSAIILLKSDADLVDSFQNADFRPLLGLAKDYLHQNNWLCKYLKDFNLTSKTWFLGKHNTQAHIEIYMKIQHSFQFYRSSGSVLNRRVLCQYSGKITETVTEIFSNVCN